MNHARFHINSLRLNGLINFNHCFFHGEVDFFVHIYKSKYEPGPTHFNVRSFKSFVAKRPIKFYKSQFHVLDADVTFRVNEAARELNFIDCEFYTKRLIIDILFGDDRTLLSLQFYRTVLSISDIIICAESEKAYLFINMSSLTLSKVALHHFPLAGLCKNQGYLGLHLENVTWINTKTFVELINVISVNIVSSQLLLNCDTCPAIIIHGVDIRHLYYLLNHITNVIHDYSIVVIKGTTFKAHISVPNKIDTENIEFMLKNNTFIIEGSISFKAKTFKVANSLIQCPTGETAQRALSFSHVIYTCKPTCEGNNKYSMQAGILEINEQTFLHVYSGLKTDHLSLVPYPPACFPCPLGAKCEGAIQALPDYWGYVTQKKKSVSMIRCPDSYCCQGNETCKGIDFCNAGRTGTLCARCERNLTEALFTTKCLPTESCRLDLVIVILISAVLVYGIVLLSFSTIKNMVMKLLKKGYTTCKEKFQQGKVNRNSSDEQQSKEDTATDENDLKYMQLLFYYVQDSKLFTVHFPETDTKTENIVVKFLEFSPDILRAYIQVSELCFVFSTATMKVVLSLSFGFLVMTFLFFVYCIQKITSYIVQKKSHFVTLEIKLVKAFLVTVLLSYQKLVMGALMLVQCIDIRDKAMLFVQADIQCYTWWQIGTIMYVCTCIVPMFIVIAHVPYYVQEGKMSTRTFILSCLFPLPVMALHYVGRYRNTNTKITRKNVTRDLSSDVENESLGMSEILMVDKTETEGKLNFKMQGSIKINQLQVVEMVTSFNEGDVKRQENSVLETETEQELSIVEDVLENSAQETSDEQESDIVWIKQSDTATKSIVKNKSEMEVSIKSEEGTCQEEIVESLLKDYKCLSMFGIRFTWLGVHKIYRVILVGCRTFITEPVTRLYAMSALVTMMTALNAFIKPYKEQRANTTATLSYLANLLIAMISIGKAHLVNYGCDTSCDHRDTVVRYMSTVEDVLLLYVPLVAMGLWAIQTGFQKCLRKCKK